MSGINQQKLEQFKTLCQKVDWNVEAERRELLRELDPLVTDWTDQLPDLRDIFQPGQVEQLIWDSIKFNGHPKTFRGERFIGFVARTGYKDQPPSHLDVSDKPPLRRTTAVHFEAGCKVPDKNILRELFKIYDRYDANYADDWGFTHFHAACVSGLADVVEKFLRLGYDPDLRVDKTADSPLHLALRHANGKVAEALLKRGADPNAANARGATALTIVCRGRHARDLAKTLFEHSQEKYRPLRVDGRDKLGNAPLHTALARGLKSLFELLLEQGADPSLANAKGLTPLHFLAKGSRDTDWADRISELIGAERGKSRLLIDARDGLGKTPLHYAAEHGHALSMRVLLEHGADPNAIDAEGSTTLHIVAKRKHNGYDNSDDELAEMLFERSQERYRPLRVDVRDQEGDTALHAALRNRLKMKVVDVLLRNGADPNKRDASGSTPLHILGGCGDAVSQFFRTVDEIQAVLQLEARDGRGRTPLNRALFNGGLNKTSELLLRRGADPNTADEDGMTPLHAICRNRIQFNWYKGSVEKFFAICDERQQTVRIDARDSSGRTALQLATKNLRVEDFDALLERGADLGPGFVFPEPSDVNEWLGWITATGHDITDTFRRKRERWVIESKLLLASSVLAVCESLERRGAYELSREDARAVMRLFLDAGLRVTPRVRDCVGRIRKYENLAEEAKGKRMKPGVSLYDVFWAEGGEKEARKLLTYRDYIEFARGDRLSHNETMSRLCAIYLCEQMGRRFFKRWALEPLQRLTHHRLPWFVCDMIMENADLSNEDLWCIFAADESLNS